MNFLQCTLVLIWKSKSHEGNTLILGAKRKEKEKKGNLLKIKQEESIITWTDGIDKV